MNYNESLKFCKASLQKVSRSFALTIPFIDKPIRDMVMLGYLEARILDTIEDSTAKLGVKKALMDKWLGALAIEKWNENIINNVVHNLEEIKVICSEIDKNEYKELIKNISKVLIVHSHMGKDFWKISYKWFNEMKEGMKLYLNKEIETMEDYNNYCYYVAGTVGGFLTDLLNLGIKDKQIKQKLEQTYNDFGLFLQKVNIIRDFREDTLQNRYFWPKEKLKGYDQKELLDKKNIDKAIEILNELVEDAFSHTKKAEEYIETIPKEYKGFKRFSKINYLLALETLKKIKNNKDVFLSDKPVKVSRSKVAEIIAKSIN